MQVFICFGFLIALTFMAMQSVGKHPTTTIKQRWLQDISVCNSMSVEKLWVSLVQSVWPNPVALK